MRLMDPYLFYYRYGLRIRVLRDRGGFSVVFAREVLRRNQSPLGRVEYPVRELYIPRLRRIAI